MTDTDKDRQIEQLKSNIAALEQLLEVHEKTVMEQSERSEATDNRNRFLAEASAVLSSSLDFETTLQSVARLAVPTLADWCAVDIVEDDGEFRRVEVAHPDPTKRELAHELERKYPTDPNSEFGVPQVLRSGKPELVPYIPEELLEGMAVDEEHLRMIRELALRSYIIVPLRARGMTLGAITFVSAESGRTFGPDDLELAVELGRRAAMAVDHARIFRAREHALRALEVSNKELDQFAYVASHDLKAPLRGIANLSQWIEEDLGDRVTDEAREHLTLLRGRVQRMEGLIDGILQYSRTDRAQEPPESIDVGEVLTDVIELIAPPEGADIQVAEDMPVLFTERLPLQQVFMNLIGNALKYARRPDVLVEVTVDEQRDFHEFAVTDNGPGIAPEYHERIFGIFQVLEARDSVEGTGIGLSLVKKIVENRGGEIRVESDLGKGSSFKFTWPTVAA